MITLFTHFISHFTYWILLWFILYVFVKRINNQYRFPNPYWLLIIGACNNLLVVLYTIYLICKSNYKTKKTDLITILLFIIVNFSVKVIPILLLHYNILFDEQYNPYNLKEIQLSLSYGIGLFVIYFLFCIYIDCPYDKNWFLKKKENGLLAKDGPFVSILKKNLSLDIN